MQAAGACLRAGALAEQSAPVLSAGLGRAPARAEAHRLAGAVGRKGPLELGSSFRNSASTSCLFRALAQSSTRLPSTRPHFPARMAADDNGAPPGKNTPYLSGATALINGLQKFVFDCDGVITKGDSLIDGVPETLDLPRALGSAGDAEEFSEPGPTDVLAQIKSSSDALQSTRNTGEVSTAAAASGPFTSLRQHMDGLLAWSSKRGTKNFLGAAILPGRAALVKFAILASLLGLQPCASAWARSDAQPILSIFDLGGLSDIQSGFASAFLLIFFSEIGDKTFFIAALLAARRSSVAVFSGTFGALAIMTVISVFLGRIFHYIDGVLPRIGDQKLPLDDIAAAVLLVYFGVSTLLEASSMDDSDSGEEQQEAELAIAGVSMSGATTGTVVATFALVFVAEWGDKSFFSTIALAAASSPLGVVIGAIAGHGAATMLAVLGGSFLGNYVSEKVIAYIGGVLFLSFAGITLYEILN